MTVLAAPTVFDRVLVRDRLRRAARTVDDHFLVSRIAPELVERLSAVQRTFRVVVDLGTPTAAAADLLVEVLPDAAVIRAAFAASGSGPWLGLVADEELNPFKPAGVDLVVSLLSLQAVNDLPGAFAQIRRSLKPDGLMIAALLGGQTLQELRSVLAETEAEMFGGASPRVAPFSDLRDLGHLLQRAGFALPVTDLDRVTARYDTLFGLLRDLRGMGATNNLVDRRHHYVGRRFFLRAAELYAERYADTDGKLRATFDIVWLSGWAPHESQQKPLRPGSAKMRLADALGVPERKLDGS